jgi:hypothetical protein
VKWTSLIGQSKAEAVALFCEVVCIHSSRGVALVQGELACVQGELFVVFELCIISSCSLIEHCFVSDVSKTCLLQVILFFAFLLVFNCLLEFLLVVSFLFFFSWLPKCVCCQCTHQGGIESHVWFEDWWMVASWCHE